MAVINKDLALMSFGNTFARLGNTPLDSTEIWYSLSEAQEYAKGQSAYVGQIIKVVDESNNKTTAYIIKDVSGNLQELGSASSTSSKVVEDEEEMLALTDIKNGQMVFRKDTGTFFILVDETNITDLNSWMEQSSSGAVWVNGDDAKVNFHALTYSAYLAESSKNENTLYFITDKGMIFKGSSNVTSSIESVTAFDGDGSISVTDALENRLYINPTTLEIRVKINGFWTIISPGYITDGSNWAQTTDNSKLATIGAIKTGIASTIEEASKNKIDSMGDGNEDEIVLSTSDGSIKRSSKKIGGATLSETPDENTVATEAAVMNKFAWKYI